MRREINVIEKESVASFDSAIETELKAIRIIFNVHFLNRKTDFDF